MLTQQVAPHVYAVSLGVVNAFLLDAGAEGLTLVDAGVPGSEDTIIQAVKELGRTPNQIKNILVTHAHPDHIGGLAAIQKTTGAAVTVHATDADIVRRGLGFRPLTPSPGFVNRLMFRLFVRPVPVVGAVSAITVVQDGDRLPITPEGIQVIHCPGHTAGHVAYLWPRHGGVLFAGDACANLMGLGWSLGYEDFVQAGSSLKTLSSRPFESVCFGHGPALKQGAAVRFRRRFSQTS